MTTPYVDPQTIHNPAAGGKPPATWGDTVRDDLEFLIAPPMVKATRNTSQSIADATWTAVDFNAAEEWDTDAFHSTSTNPSRITIPSGLGGRYALTAGVVWDTDTTGLREARLIVNGTTIVSDVIVPATNGYSRFNVVGEAALTATAYAEVQVYQSSGAARSVSGWFSARFISR